MINNKGLTLIELLISISLMGIVMVFLLNILSDLRNETDNNNFAFNNQLLRTEAIYTIEQDLNKYTLISITDNSDNNLELTFNLEDQDKIIITSLQTTKKTINNSFGVDEDIYYLNYTDALGKLHTWEMKDAILDNCGYFTFNSNNTLNSYYLKINIPIYNKDDNEFNNKLNNNAVDDIEITYSGIINKIILNNSEYLSGNNIKNKPVGNCTN